VSLFTNVRVKDFVYPPERFPVSAKLSLSAGANPLDALMVKDTGYIAVVEALWSSGDIDRADVNIDSISGAISTPLRGGRLYIARYMVLETVNISLTVSSAKTVCFMALMRFDKRRAVAKYMAGRRVSSDELSSILKIDPDALTKLQIYGYKLFDPFQSISIILPFEKTLTSSGTVYNLSIPDGFRATILDLQIDNTSSVDAYINISRDNMTLPSIYVGASTTSFLQPLNTSLYIHALNSLRIDLDHRGSGQSITVRGVVALARLSIPEKIRWGLTLSADEKIVADRYNLYSLVEAGLI